ALHLVGVDALGVEDDGDRVAPQRGAREHVDLDETARGTTIRHAGGVCGASPADASRESAPLSTSGEAGGGGHPGRPGRGGGAGRGGAPSTPDAASAPTPPPPV